MTKSTDQMERVKIDYDPLIEISQEATREASKALSKFVRAPLNLGTIRVEILKEVDISAEIDAWDPVYAVSCAILGDATGLAVLCMPMRTASGLCDLLFHRDSHVTREIDAEGQDALLELGNIVVGNYLRAFARAMPSTTFVHQAAKMLHVAKADLNSQLRKFWQSAGTHDAMVFEVAFNFRHASLGCSVVILMDANRVRGLLEQHTPA